MWPRNPVFTYWSWVGTPDLCGRNHGTSRMHGYWYEGAWSKASSLVSVVPCFLSLRTMACWFEMKSINDGFRRGTLETVLWQSGLLEVQLSGFAPWSMMHAKILGACMAWRVGRSTEQSSFPHLSTNCFSIEKPNWASKRLLLGTEKTEFLDGDVPSSLNKERTTRFGFWVRPLILSILAVEELGETCVFGDRNDVIGDPIGLPLSFPWKYLDRVSDNAHSIRSIPASPLKCFTFCLRSFWSSVTCLE